MNSYSTNHIHIHSVVRL